MKRKSSVLLLMFFCLCVCFVGCKESRGESSDAKKQNIGVSQELKGRLERAATAYELADLLTMTADYMKYSECENDKEFSMYFDLLGRYDYVILSRGEEKYLLFEYVYAEYGVEMVSVTRVDKEYKEDGLWIHVSGETRGLGQTGCAPDYSYVHCIVKLEEDITSLYVDDRAYKPYDGGYIRVKELWGMVDEELNIVVPVKYNWIEPYESVTSEESWYTVRTDEGNGLLDENYQEVLPTCYGRIIMLDGDRFLVEKYKENGVELDWSQIGIVGRNGAIYQEFIEGLVDGERGYCEGELQLVFTCRRRDDHLRGVLDEELNIIIEPKYKDISVFDVQGKDDVFYVVENKRGKFAVFDSSGKQQTKFEKGSVYEMKEKYDAMLEG